METTKPGTKSSKIWLVALPLLALGAGAGLWSLSSGSEPEVTRVRPGDSPLAKIAIQPGDLPKEYRLCPFSGDIKTYLANTKRLNMDTYKSVSESWTKLQAAGATDAYSATYGDSKEACDSVLGTGSRRGMEAHSMDEAGEHPSTVFSFVVQFKEAEAAAAAYESNIFGQKSLKGQPDIAVAEGEGSGMGANATVSASIERLVPLRQAVWQKNRINVYFGSENLPLAKSRQVMNAINKRIP